ncbi:MAG: sigma 54-interacting transcriptional regulator, partial [Planctomycetota bacterium]
CREQNPLELRRVFLGEVQEVSPGRYLKYLGLLEAVRDGTLYLEEVENLSMDMQRILSRVLDERRFSPLGSDSVLPFRGRLMASTVADLAAGVAERTIHQHFHKQIASHMVRLERSPGYE